MSIGAVFMILNLASDPFVQQLVTFQPSTIFQDDPNVSLPRASSYSRSDINGPTYPMIVAISAGFGANDPNTTAVFPINCPSSQCIYTPFRTLGFCSECRDTTPSLRRISNYSTRFSVGDSSYSYFADAFTFDDVVLANAKNPGGDTIYVVMNSSISVNSTNSSSRAAFSEPGANLTFATFSFINITDVPTVYNWPNSTLSASKCALSLCIQEVQSNVTNGTLVETVTPLQMEAHDDGGAVTIYDPSRPNDQYLIPDYVVIRLQQYLYNFLPGVALDITEGPANRYRPDYTTNYVTVSGNSTFFPNSVVEIIYNSTNLTETFANVATAMSHSMRQYADGSPRVSGQVGLDQTVVIVRWLWIILPLGSILLGLIFLAITVWQTNRGRLPLWKSGQLPLVLHGIASPQDGHARSRKPTRTSAMEDRARDMLIGVHTSLGDGLRIQTSKNTVDWSQKPGTQQEKVSSEPVRLARKPVAEACRGSLSVRGTTAQRAPRHFSQGDTCW